MSHILLGAPGHHKTLLFIHIYGQVDPFSGNSKINKIGSLLHGLLVPSPRPTVDVLVGRIAVPVSQVAEPGRGV